MSLSILGFQSELSKNKLCRKNVEVAEFIVSQLHLLKLWMLCQMTKHVTFISYLRRLQRVPFRVSGTSSYCKAVVRFKNCFTAVSQIQIKLCWEEKNVLQYSQSIFAKTVKIGPVNVTFYVRLLWIWHFNVKLCLLTFPREDKQILNGHNFESLIIQYFLAWLILRVVICY